MRNVVINETSWEEMRKSSQNDGVKVSRSTPIGSEQLVFYRVEYACYRLPKQTC